jgi:hypothetical protein
MPMAMSRMALRPVLLSAVRLIGQALANRD